MLVYCSLTASLWYGHRITVNRSLPPSIATYLTPFRRTLILLLVTLYVFVSYCLVPLLAVLGVTSVVVGAHAAGRDTDDIKILTHQEVKGDERGMVDV